MYNNDFYFINELNNNNFKKKIEKDYYLYFEKVKGISSYRDHSLKAIKNQSIIPGLDIVDKNYFLAIKQYENLFYKYNCNFYGFYSKSNNKLVAHTCIRALKSDNQNIVNVQFWPVFSPFGDNEKDNISLNINKNLYMIIYKYIEQNILDNNIYDKEIHIYLLDNQEIMHDTLINMDYYFNGKYYSKKLELEKVL